MLVAEWAEAELFEIRQVWFPSVAPGFQDHQAGYRQLGSQTSREVRIAGTGWIMAVLMVGKPLHHRTLKSHYVDGLKVGGHARRSALDAFSRAHAAWESSLGFDEDPL